MQIGINVITIRKIAKMQLRKYFGLELSGILKTNISGNTPGGTPGDAQWFLLDLHLSPYLLVVLRELYR